MINDKLECNIATTDIAYKLRNNTGKEGDNRVRVAFKQRETKTKVCKAKNLKGTQLWITNYRYDSIWEQASIFTCSSTSSKRQEGTPDMDLRQEGILNISKDS